MLDTGKYLLNFTEHTVFIIINTHILINAYPPWFENKTHHQVHYMIIKKLL